MKLGRRMERVNTSTIEHSSVGAQQPLLPVPGPEPTATQVCFEPSLQTALVHPTVLVLCFAQDTPIPVRSYIVYCQNKFGGGAGR